MPFNLKCILIDSVFFYSLMIILRQLLLENQDLYQEEKEI